MGVWLKHAYAYSANIVNQSNDQHLRHCDMCVIQSVKCENSIHTSVTRHLVIKLGSNSVLSSLKPGHLLIIRPVFSQISASLQADSCNCNCINCGSDSNLQFTFLAYTQVTNVKQVSAAGTGGRLIPRSVYMQVYMVCLYITQNSSILS